MIYIEHNYVVMDYTDEIREALGKLKKFMEKTGKHVELQDCLFLRCDHNGDFVLFATDGAALGMYRLKTDVCIPSGKELSLIWSTRKMDTNKITLRFHFDEEYCPGIKKLLNGWEGPFAICIKKRGSFLHFCEQVAAKKKTPIARVIRFYEADGRLLCKGGEYGIDCEYVFDSYASDDLISCNSETLDFFSRYPLTFSAQYLKKITSCLTGKSFKFSFNSISSFASFSEGNYRYLVMPRAEQGY